MAHNVESVIWQRYHETASNPLARWYIKEQWRKFVNFERWAVRDADLTVAVSALDAQRFARDFGASAVDVVDNGVDTEYFHPQPVPRDPRQLLFLGSLDWRPNLDGVALLLDRIFPAVRAAEPGARLVLVGRNPSEALCRRAAAAGVEVCGNVPDVRPYLARCGAMVVPLRIGGGSRLKILEALAMGAPVVSTRIGAEGLTLEAGKHLRVVEEIDDVAAALVATIRAPAEAQEQANAGRRQVLRLYDWDHLADRLEQMWLRCTSEAPCQKVAA
jgi:glycosyltransferase involved in cell wall biosynthesis